MPREPSLDDKSNVPRQAVFSFKINIGTCRYKGTLVFFPEAIHPLDVFEGHEHVSPPRRSFLLGGAQMSVLILSRELSIFVRVFLMRNAVSLADGFWYQHSFMSLAMEVKV